MRKNIGLVAHDNRKADLIEWSKWNYEKLHHHKLICTGTTGGLVKDFFDSRVASTGVEKTEVVKLKSGPLGGDQQLGALISEGKIDVLIFLWDPMQPQPHDVDVKALMRIAVLYNIPIANNRATADYMISSPLFAADYRPIVKDYRSYIDRLQK